MDLAVRVIYGARCGQGQASVCLKTLSQLTA